MNWAKRLSTPAFTVRLVTGRTIDSKMRAGVLVATLLSILMGCTGSRVRAREDDVIRSFDVVVYGGTSSAVMAAIQARRSGRTVAIVCPETHLGGMTTNGLGWTDSGNKAVVGGLAREFYQHVKAYYDNPDVWTLESRDNCRGYRAGDDAMWVFEPHVAEQILERMLTEAEVPVFRDQWLDRSAAGVQKAGARMTSVRMMDGNAYEARVFIDATHEGDLMAAAGVAYVVGRESNERYGETLNGVQTRNARSHQFDVPIDPYVVPGDPSSGLLPRIQPGGPGEEGAGDRRVQAYNFRLCMTRHPDNRVPFSKPPAYDPAQYELLLRYVQASPRPRLGKFDPMPNAKTDTNNNGPFSTDNIARNYDYPEASYKDRAAILAEHEQYQRGLFYFLASDPRVPEPVREDMASWGLAADEFADNNHWPRQIYVREARRMVSDFVVTERHLRRLEPTPDPIGMGSYNMDSHNVQRYVARDDQGRAIVRNEGDVQVSPGGPYPIGFGAIIPKRDECTNLLVPVCASSSHIAYGSIRMEPVFMILGQSAGIAASLAIEENVAVQDIDRGRLSAQLTSAGQVCLYPSPNPSSSVAISPTSLPGIVVDDDLAVRVGRWVPSVSISPFVGAGYIHDDARGDGSCRVLFDIPVVEPGRYEVRMAYAAHENRATNVPVDIEVGDVRERVIVNERARPGIDGLWTVLTRVEVESSGVVRVVVSDLGADGYVVVDAIQLIRLEDAGQR